MLTLQDLHRTFDDVVALDSVSMEVQPGRLHGFVGRNGAGKTTTMRIALGLTTPDRGAVLWKGTPASAADRRRFGYMPEERGLYPKMRLADQVTFFGELSGFKRSDARARATALLERLGLGERLGDDVASLSLGNQQRVQLATALIHSPDVLVLDEPFSGLDPVGVDILAGVLEEEADRGVGIVFSSHQLEVVERLCEVVTIVDEGRVVADGPIEELRSERADARVRVEVATIDDTWLDRVPGAEVIGHDGAALLVTLAHPSDDQTLLDAARSAGAVRSFSPVVPTLADLFRGLLDRPHPSEDDTLPSAATGSEASA